jgi:putative acetyltransferase
MLKLVRTDSTNTDFIELVNQLNSYLQIMDGDDHAFYNQYNGIESLKNVIVVYIDNHPVACGAFKKFDENRVEIKRMYTSSSYRGNGVASNLLNELETWAKELSFSGTILETGIRQIEAVQFYKKNQYKIIANYGPYIGVENSICFEKKLA